ncbi:hypothetical protein GCM10022198_09050 [Klugiella xanthotipulae]
MPKEVAARSRGEGSPLSGVWMVIVTILASFPVRAKGGTGRGTKGLRALKFQEIPLLGEEGVEFGVNFRW